MTTNQTNPDRSNGYPFAVIHVPHSSQVIPPNARTRISLSDAELDKELLRMTDHFTDDLFCVPKKSAVMVRYPVSRLVADPERFVDDQAEPMAARGMGAIYTRTSIGGVLRDHLDKTHRQALLETYYAPHQHAVTLAVAKSLDAHGNCLIVDAHSFSNHPLPHEPDQQPNRPAICIGTDSFHTPTWLTDQFAERFHAEELTVKYNSPFGGSFVPQEYFQQEHRVMSIMIEVNRRLYMNETTGERNSDFDLFNSIIVRVLTDLIDQVHIRLINSSAT